MNPLKIVYRTWFTGVLFCLAILGYVFYSVLIFIRMLQTKKIFLFLLGALFIVAAGMLTFFIPMKQQGKEITVIVEPGTSVRSVATILKEKKVIPSIKAFLLWIKIKDLEKSMQAGRYGFYEYEGVISAAKKFLHAEPIDTSITIPEGLIIEQTASIVAEVFEIDTSEFIRLCNNKEFIEKRGLSVSSLEGYLFPNTYRFRPEAKSVEIITRMVKHFIEEYSSILQTESSKSFTQAEIVTLASIIEKEATLPDERTRISGVFHNRLRLNMMLGADPTVRYALKKFSGPLRVSELKNSSPYNTRVHAGLPPGPICSPGQGSLEAAICPMETDELFFVAKWDGSGAHDFSVSHVQHERKKRDIRKKNYLQKLKKMREKK